MAVGPTGKIYVTDSYHLAAFDPSGHFLFGYGRLDAQGALLNNPRGVAVRPDGTIVVADTNNRRIQVLESGGSFLSQFGGSGTLASSPASATMG